MLDDRLLKKLSMFIWNSSYMILLICTFRWHNIKDEGIFDPMEKILVKKELYKWIYKFLNFWEFSGFYFYFSGFI